MMPKKLHFPDSSLFKVGQPGSGCVVIGRGGMEAVSHLGSCTIRSRADNENDIGEKCEVTWSSYTNILPQTIDTHQGRLQVSL